MAGCKFHSEPREKVLFKAVDENGRERGIYDANKHKHLSYFCPVETCGKEVRPYRKSVGGVIEFRRPHFKLLPDSTKRKITAPIPLKHKALNSLEQILIDTGEFDIVEKRASYSSQLVDDDGHREWRDFNIDIYAHSDHGDVAIHVVRVPIQGSADLKVKMKELSQPKYGYKERFVQTKQGQIEPHSNIHQNILVIKDYSSFSSIGNNITLKATEHSLILPITNTMNFYDPHSRNIEVYNVVEGGIIDEHPDGIPSKFYEFTMEEFETCRFKFGQREPKVFDYVDSDKGNVDMPMWRAAIPVYQPFDGVHREKFRMGKQQDLF